jgi:cysteine desulfurase / selenocysteine lyase
LLDIEGTTTPITFVADTLFPLARERVDPFLAMHAGRSDVAAIVTELRRAWDAEDPASRQPSAWPADSRDAAVEYALWLMASDRKLTPLKALQGLIWEQSYREGRLVAPVYEDVAPALEAWAARGCRASIYSSGSVLAQRLLFAHTTAGDLTPLLGSLFDTTIAPSASPPATAPSRRPCAQTRWSCSSSPTSSPSSTPPGPPAWAPRCACATSSPPSRAVTAWSGRSPSCRYACSGAGRRTLQHPSRRRTQPPTHDLERREDIAISTLDVIAAQDFDLLSVGVNKTGCASVVHLNNAGAALMPEPVVRAIVAHLRLECDVGGYEAAVVAQDALQLAYDRAAILLGCLPEEVAIVENATRAWTLALEAIPFAPGDRILVGRSEYVSNCLALARVCAVTQAGVEIVPSAACGAICLDALRAMLDERVRLIALTHIPTSGGAQNPAAEVGKIARGAGIVYLIDACQSVGQFPVDVEELACDFLTTAGRKYLRGPRGTALLYVRSAMFDRLQVATLDVRGTHWLADGGFGVRGDARRFESWETNCASKIGLGVAIEYALGWGLDAVWERIRVLGERLRTQLALLRGVRIHEPRSLACGITSFRVDGHDARAIQHALHSRSINVSVSETALTPFRSRRLGDSLVRASVHYYNSEGELDTFADAMTAIAASAPGAPAPTPRASAAAARVRPNNLHVAIVVVPGTSDLENWGDADVVGDVRDVLEDAGVRCSEVIVDSPADVDALAAPNVLAFPNARRLRDEAGAGSIPELLAARGIALIGADARGHAARSKIHMKQVLERHGLPTPRWALLACDTLATDVAKLRFPLIVKPDAGSESVGVVRVDDRDALERLAVCDDEPPLVEEWIRAHEFTVAVIGNGPERRGFPLEVVVPDNALFLTADVKQRSLLGTTQPVSDPTLTAQLEELAIAVAAALGIADWCRVDVLQDADGFLHTIDVNTLPGLRRQHQRVSYYPLCLQYACGADFAATLLALIAVSLRRHTMPLPHAVRAAHEKLFAT